MTTDSSHQSRAELVEDFAWQAHPARQRPLAALLAILIILSVGAACASWAGWWWGAGAAVLLVLSLHRFFFPSSFTIGPDHVTARYLFGTQQCAWTDIRRYCRDQHGVFLSTRSRPSRLDAYLGTQLLFGDARDQVMQQINDKLPRRSDS